MPRPCKLLHAARQPLSLLLSTAVLGLLLLTLWQQWQVSQRSQQLAALAQALHRSTALQALCHQAVAGGDGGKGAGGAAASAPLLSGLEPDGRSSARAGAGAVEGVEPSLCALLRWAASASGLAAQPLAAGSQLELLWLQQQAAAGAAGGLLARGQLGAQRPQASGGGGAAGVAPREAVGGRATQVDAAAGGQAGAWPLGSSSSQAGGAQAAAGRSRRSSGGGSGSGSASPHVASLQRELGSEGAVPDIFIGVFSAPDTPEARAAEAWGQHSALPAAAGSSSSSSAPLRPSYRMRRAALRSSWFPASPHQRRQLRAQLGVALRFVVGGVADPGAEAQLAAEQALYGDILRLPDIKEGYHGLAAKTRAFFALVAALYPAAPAAGPGPRWVVKVDDDVWLSPARLRAASLQWSRMAAGYVGCMKHGVVWTEQQSRWGEPQHLLLGPRYFIHAYGSAYAIAGQVVREVLGPAAASLRLLANEDTSVGSWMLAHNVKHFEDMRLCAQACHPAAVAVGRPECAGLCDPVNDLVAAQNNTDCTGWGRWDHVQLQLPNGTRLTSRLKKERAGFVKVAAPSNVTGPVWEWWPMTQIVPGELPYLAPYPEHTAFSSMWV